ncbi:hypothetical protein [Streptosporangium pseudovulgare]|uniref:DUF3558 domain-containing protein n=1 Tax=Streptosporangium pseudovulgare TaxID=35765 RepID=A0ABQ2QW57_9ACTN|nr:hypothetical protein [Streptosporangium pseudovulgare]GGQ00642.1 hypothetical protein GCM10010140_33450 [Streptosporangium pseudovulgare]
MRLPRLGVPLLLGLLITSACTMKNEGVSTPTPDNTEMIADSAPYLCGLVPERAFRLAGGVAGPLEERTNGTGEDGDCLVPTTGPGLLEVVWIRETAGSSPEYLDDLMDDRRKVFTRHGAMKLSSDLGEGYAVYFPEGPFSDRPYQVTARFSCGGKDRIIDLALAKVSKGRDGIKDMVELMRIAQKRYGLLHGCTPGA